MIIERTPTEKALFDVVTQGVIPGVNGVGIEQSTRETDDSSWHEIEGIDGFIRLSWSTTPPSGEDVLTITGQLAIAVAIQAKVNEVTAWWESFTDAGYDTGLGWVLAAKDSDRDKLDQSRNQLILKAATENMATYTTVLFDRNGMPHLLTGDQAIAILGGCANAVESAAMLFAGYLGLIGAGNTSFTVGDPLPEPEE